MQLASKIRQEVLDSVTDEERNKYDTSERLTLEERLKKELRDKIDTIYVKELNISPQILEPIVANAETAF